MAPVNAATTAVLLPACSAHRHKLEKQFCIEMKLTTLPFFPCSGSCTGSRLAPHRRLKPRRAVKKASWRSRPGARFQEISATLGPKKLGQPRCWRAVSCDTLRTRSGAGALSHTSKRGLFGAVIRIGVGVSAARDRGRREGQQIPGWLPLSELAPVLTMGGPTL